jgi:hypothetical protein
LRNDFFACCHGRESELVGALDTETATYQRAFLGETSTLRRSSPARRWT